MYFILIIGIVAALFMAFNNGANDVANAFASAVGSKALKVKQALIIASVLNFIGAVCLGGNVAHTLVSEIANFQSVTNNNEFILGMFSCLIASGLFVMLSTYTGLPVSSSHAIVGSMTGIALLLGGSGAVNWQFLAGLTGSWIIFPLVSALTALIVIKFIKLVIFNGDEKKMISRACFWIPFFGCVVFTTFVFALLTCPFLSHITEDGSNFWKNYFLFFFPFLFVIFYAISVFYAKQFGEGAKCVERIFRRFQAGTSCLVGFAIGSNDVSNSITPVLAIYFIAKFGKFPDTFCDMSIPVWLLALGGLGMSTGILMLGHKVMATLGHKITLLNSSRGFAVDFSTASSIILSSIFGLPVSSTHAATGAVIGVGLERGIKEGLNLRLLLKIFITWFITVPAAALCTVAIYGILRLIMFFIM